MATLHMLIGIPGSGKSTYCNNVLIKKYQNAIYIASDKVRDDNPNLAEKEIWPKIYSLCFDALKNSQDVIYDATNITPNVRNRFFSKLNELGSLKYNKIAYFFNTSADKCIERVSLRNQMPNERFLPLEVIESYGKNIIIPTLEEGFKEIILIDNNQNDDNYQTKTIFQINKL